MYVYAYVYGLSCDSLLSLSVMSLQYPTHISCFYLPPSLSGFDYFF